MQNIGIGDVFFILLILGVIHGVMHLVSMSKGQRAKDSRDSSIG
jgi:hypothetical protein